MSDNRTPTKFGQTSFICTRVASDCNCPGSETKIWPTAAGTAQREKSKSSDSEDQVLTDEVQAHRSKVAGHRRGNHVGDAIPQSARAAGVFSSSLRKKKKEKQRNTRPQTARDGEEEDDRKCPGYSSVRTRSCCLSCCPAWCRPGSVAEGHIYVLNWTVAI